MALHCCKGKQWAEAKVPLETDCSGRPFAIQTPKEGAFGSRSATGAPGKKLIPLVPDLAMPVWEYRRWVGLQSDGVDRAK